MRILQATDSYPPPLVGGRDLHVQMLAHELAGRGHDVEVVTLAGPDGGRTEMDGTVPVHRLDGWIRALNRFYVERERPLHPTVPDPGMVRLLVKIIRRQRPEVIHAHSWMLHSLLPLLPSNQSRLVVTMHDYGLVCPKGTLVYRGGVCEGPGFIKCVRCAGGQYGALRASALTTGMAITRPTLRHVDRYIAVSTPVAKACESVVAGGRVPIEVIPPFLADETLDGAARARPEFVPAEGGYVMFAGALGAHKGVDVLLEAWREVESPIPLVLVGLRRHDTALTLPEGTIVAENVPHGDVIRAWAHCTIAVVPSCWPDPCPLVALEAMAAGRPVVASAVGGLVDLVQDGTTGLLVPPGNVAALRHGLDTLLRQPELCSRMGMAGRRRAARFSGSAVVPQIERIYEEAITTPSRPLARGRYVFR